MNNNILQINELIALIEDFSPNELNRLKKEFPNATSILRTGQHLGEGDNNLLIVKMSVCISGLNIIISKCKDLMPKMKKKIDKISTLQLISQLIVALSGAAIISTLQQEGFIWLKYISSALVLIGSLLGIYVQHISNSIYNNNSFFSIYSALNENYLQAEQHLTDLEIFSKINQMDDKCIEEVSQIIRNANATSIQIRKLIAHQ